MSGKKLILMFCLAVFVTVLFMPAAAQDEAEKTKQEPYVFTVDCEVKATPVKSQAASSTCWCFATISFLESELPGLNWETRLREFRERCSKSRHLVPGQNIMLNELILFNVLIALCGTLFMIYSSNPKFIPIPLCLSLVFLVFSIILYVALAREGRRDDRCTKLWAEINRRQMPTEKDKSV